MPPKALPIPRGAFIENKGQLARADIRFYSMGNPRVAFEAGAVSIVFEQESSPSHGPHAFQSPEENTATRAAHLRLRFEGASGADPIGQSPTGYRSNFFLGRDPARWRTDLPSYDEVAYRDLYPGIDLVYRIGEHGLKYEFEVRPGADPARIAIAYEGIGRLTVSPEGVLIASTALGDVRDSAPMAWQGDTPVPCAFVVRGEASYGFACGGVDATRPLTIDPLVYSTFLGGAATDAANAVAVDAAGDAYVAGFSVSPDFPTTPGAFDPSASGGWDAFVTKLNATGTGLVYSTFLGGARRDDATSIAVDAAGRAFVTGSTTSRDFPITPGAFKRTCGADGDCDLVGPLYRSDVFVAVLDSAGSGLVYSTYLGGVENDIGYSVAFDAAGAAYVAGVTLSRDFPTSPSAFDRTCGSDAVCNFDGLRNLSDGFAAKFNPSGSALAYSTYLGGGKYDGAYDVAVDPSGDAFVTGDTASDDYPVTAGAFQTVRGTDNVGDSFVAKLNSTGSGLVYSTFLGGSGGDESSTGIVLDAAGDAYLAGMTYSPDFPTTPGAFDRTYTSTGLDEYDAYVAKLNPTGSGLFFSTLLGGYGQDGWSNGNLAVTAGGEIYVSGQTNSPNFPTTPGAFDRTCGYDGTCDNLTGTRRYDAFLTKFNANASALVYSTFLGGASDEFPAALATDAQGDAYVVGATLSNDFPTTAGAFETNSSGSWDAVVLKLAPLPDLTIRGISAVPSPPVATQPANVTVNVTDIGDVDVGLFTVLAFEDRNGNGLPDPGEFLAEQLIPRLAVFASIVVPYPWTPDVSGVHRICAIADSEHLVREGNETNNLGCADIVAVSPPILAPDYTPVAPQPNAPISIGEGLTITFSVQVANLGNGTANRTATLAFFNASSPVSPFRTFAVPPLAPTAISARFAATWRSPAALGTYNVTAEVDYGNDLAEWDESNNGFTWSVDVRAGPVTTLVVGAPNYTAVIEYVASSTPLSFTILDQSGTGIRNTKYRVDGGAWVNYTATGSFTLAGEGAHLLEWFSEDNVGNVEPLANATLRVDNTPPTTFRFVGNPQFLAAYLFVTSASLLSLSATDGGITPVGLGSTEFRIDGSSWTAYAAPFTLAGEGAHRVDYRSSDLLGNAEPTRDETLVVDDTPPTTNLSPAIGPYTTATAFTLSAIDVGSGVAGTEYRIDGGTWTPYADGFALDPGDHTIVFRSPDRLGNREPERTRAVHVEEPPASLAVNLKPLVAAVFAVILALAGAWSSRRRPWNDRTDRRAVARAFLLVSFPFVVLEASTGILSYFTGLLAIPPLLGLGTAVDVGVLAAGLALAAVRMRGASTKGAEPVGVQ